MKTAEHRENEHEKSVVEHERWTSAILQALHEMRDASVAGLDRHGYIDVQEKASPVTSPLAASILPPPPSERAA